MTLQLPFAKCHPILVIHSPDMWEELLTHFFRTKRSTVHNVQPRLERHSALLISNDPYPHPIPTPWHVRNFEYVSLFAGSDFAQLNKRG